ncbi:MAG TPA: Bro-N domain-containing protein [Gallionella sp.]|nr:Bro-N domain-containing protein [Gallionella sp.]
MSALIPFQFDGREIRVVTDEHGEPLFVGKDICDALGFSNPSKAMSDHCRGITKRYPIIDNLGRAQEARVLTEPDVLRLIVNCTLPAAQAFERLVFEEILPTIRRTGSYVSPHAKAPSALEPVKEFKALFGVAKLIGLDKNAAAISANQAVAHLTGTNILGLLGQTHLETPEQQQYFTPTELGERIKLSGRKVNMLLAEAGFQFKRGEVWEVMDAGREFSKIYDTGKKHGSGVPIQQVKWSANVLPLLEQNKAA